METYKKYGQAEYAQAVISAFLLNLSADISKAKVMQFEKKCTEDIYEKFDSSREL